MKHFPRQQPIVNRGDIVFTNRRPIIGGGSYPIGYTPDLTGLRGSALVTASTLTNGGSQTADAEGIDGTANAGVTVVDDRVDQRTVIKLYDTVTQVEPITVQIAVKRSAAAYGADFEFRMESGPASQASIRYQYDGAYQDWGVDPAYVHAIPYKGWDVLFIQLPLIDPAHVGIQTRLKYTPVFGGFPTPADNTLTGSGIVDAYKFHPGKSIADFL